MESCVDRTFTLSRNATAEGFTRRIEDDETLLLRQLQLSSDVDVGGFLLSRSAGSSFASSVVAKVSVELRRSHGEVVIGFRDRRIVGESFNVVVADDVSNRGAARNTKTVRSASRERPEGGGEGEETTITAEIATEVFRVDDTIGFTIVEGNTEDDEPTNEEESVDNHHWAVRA